MSVDSRTLKRWLDELEAADRAKQTDAIPGRTRLRWLRDEVAQAHADAQRAELGTDTEPPPAPTLDEPFAGEVEHKVLVDEFTIVSYPGSNPYR